eukprot:scaffold70119_cov89-Phaeocystis_antarctica.AAC.2
MCYFLCLELRGNGAYTPDPDLESFKTSLRDSLSRETDTETSTPSRGLHLYSLHRRHARAPAQERTTFPSGSWTSTAHPCPRGSAAPGCSPSRCPPSL